MNDQFESTVGVMDLYHVPCNCIGAQNGDPACPCAMRRIKVVDGRYVQVIDYGPAPSDWHEVKAAGCLFDQFKGHEGPLGLQAILDPNCPCPKCSPRC